MQRKLQLSIWLNFAKFKANWVRLQLECESLLESFYRFTEESAERADLAENQLGKLRAKNRSSISISRASPAVRKDVLVSKIFTIKMCS